MYNSSLHSKNNSQNQSQIAEWHNAHRWIQDKPPNNRCWYEDFGKYCKNPFCPEHGISERIRQYKKIEKLGSPDGEAYHLVAHFGTTLNPKSVSRCRECFTNKMAYRHPEMGILWRLHWEKKEPHIHAILLYDTLYYSNSPKMKKQIKHFWCQSLRKIGHPNPSQERFQIEPIRDYKGMLYYIFRVRKEDKELFPNQCPPKIQGEKWAYWKWNKNYKILCSKIGEPQGSAAD